MILLRVKQANTANQKSRIIKLLSGHHNQSHNLLKLSHHSFPKSLHINFLGLVLHPLPLRLRSPPSRLSVVLRQVLLAWPLQHLSQDHVIFVPTRVVRISVVFDVGLPRHISRELVCPKLFMQSWLHWNFVRLHLHDQGVAFSPRVFLLGTGDVLMGPWPHYWSRLAMLRISELSLFFISFEGSDHVGFSNSCVRHFFFPTVRNVLILIFIFPFLRCFQRAAFCYFLSHQSIFYMRFSCHHE